MSWPDCSPARAPSEDRSLNQRDDGAVRGQRSLPAWAWGALAVIVGLIDYRGSRYSLNPDGVSYIEMALHAVASGPHELINGYWSPGYPALIAPVLRITGNDWVTAIPALHVVNLLIYFLAAATFVGLLHIAARTTAADSTRPGANIDRFALPFGVTAFAVIALQCIGLGLLTPDFGVLLAVLMTVLCCFKVERSGHSWPWAAALGLVLGLGYWTKGILLPLNGLLLACLFVMPPHIGRARGKLALATAVFALVSLPLIVLVSRNVGRVTAGEVGRLNYAWEIDPVSSPFVGWVGDSANRFGVPAHPPRVLQAEPRTLEFATPIHATYPLWFDPSYWYAGLRPRFDFAGQRRALLQGLSDLVDLLLDQWAVVLGLLALWLATSRGGPPSDRSRLAVVLWLWSAGAALVYAAVHVEARYLAGFVAVAVIAAWCTLGRRAPRRRAAWVMAGATMALLISLFLNLRQNIGGFDAGYRPDYLIEAQKVAAAGVARGDRVAVVGDAYEAYAAFGAGTLIAAQVMDSAGFWQLPAAGRSALQARLAATGITAMLANNVAPEMRAEGWRIFSRPDSSNLGLLIFRRQ